MRIVNSLQTNSTAMRALRRFEGFIHLSRLQPRLYLNLLSNPKSRLFGIYYNCKQLQIAKRSLIANYPCSRLHTIDSRCQLEAPGEEMKPNLVNSPELALNRLLSNLSDEQAKAVISLCDDPSLDQTIKAEALAQMIRTYCCASKVSLSASDGLNLFEWALQHRLFSLPPNAGLALSYLIPLVFKATDIESAKKLVLAALEQIGPDEDLYEVGLNSLRKDLVAYDCSELAAQALEDMLLRGMRPSSHAFHFVVERLMDSGKGASHDTNVVRALTLFKKSLLQTGFGDPALGYRLVSSLFSLKQGLEMISLAYALIDQGSVPPEATARQLLKQLCIMSGTKSPELEILVRYKEPKWTDANVTHVWQEILRNRNLPHEKCFLVLIFSFWAIPKDGGYISATFMHMGCRGGTELYRHIIAVFSSMGRANPIQDVLRDMAQFGYMADTNVLNTILRHYSNYRGKYNWFKQLTQGAEAQATVKPDANSYSLVYPAAGKRGDFSLATKSFGKALFLSPDDPFLVQSYTSLFDGLLSSMRKCTLQNYLLYTKRADAVLQHGLDTGYKGPKWVLYSGVIKVNAIFVQGLAATSEGWNSYLHLFTKFNLMVRDRHITGDASMYHYMLGAMSKFKPNHAQQTRMTEDLHHLHKYMVETGTPIDSLIYSLLFEVTGVLKRSDLAHNYFRTFISQVNNKLLNQAEDLRDAFNSYFSHHLVAPDQLQSVSRRMALASAPPDAATLIALLRTYSTHRATLSDLKNVLFCLGKPLKQPLISNVSSNDSILLEMANIIHSAGGPIEMSLALDYVLRHTQSSDQYKNLSPSFFSHIIDLALSPPTQGNFDIVLTWLSKLKAFPSPESSSCFETKVILVKSLLPKIKPTPHQRQQFQKMARHPLRE